MKRTLAILFGLLLIVIALLLGAGGALALNLFDSEGRYELPVAQVDTDGAAIYVSSFNLDPSVVPDGVFTTTLEFASADSREVFLGTGSANDVQQFLVGVPYDAVTQIVDEKLVANPVPGAVLPAPQPLETDIWTASGSGTTAVLPWQQDMSEEILLLMNTDGSAGVAGDLHGVLTADWLYPAAIGSLFAAGVLLIGGLWLAVRGGRRRRSYEQVAS
jgi:hypothetical protein